MSCVGFEPKIPVFERAKTCHALDLATIVIGTERYPFSEIQLLFYRSAYQRNFEPLIFNIMTVIDSRDRQPDTHMQPVILT
jgi:hypothetical protein